MKIKKLISIKNIWSFQNFEWDKFCNCINTETKKNPDGSEIKIKGEKISELWSKAIFFGDNGNGKSTIVKILKSINNNASLPKNWDLADEDQEIKINTDSGDLIFDWLSWNSSLFNEKIHIFDKDFIKDNVWDMHDESENDTSKKRWEHFFTLWEFKEKEEKLVQLIKGRNEIKAIIWSDILSIDGLQTKLENIKEESIRLTKIQERNNELSTAEEKLKNINMKKNNLLHIKNINFPNFATFDKDEFIKNLTVFSEKLSSIDFHLGTESAIKNIILCIHKNSSKKCLVCEQSIKNNNEYISRISTLINHFTGQNIEEKEKEMNEKLWNIRVILERMKNFEKELLNNKNTYQEKITLLRTFGDVSEYFDINTIEFSLINEEIFIIDDCLNKVSEKEKSKSTEMEYSIQNISWIINKFYSLLTTISIQIENSKRILEWLKNQNIISLDQEIKNTEKEIEGLINRIAIIENYTKINNFLSECQSFYNIENWANANWSTNTCIEDLRTIINIKFNNFVEKYWGLIKQYITDINSSISIDFDCKIKWWISHNAARCGFKITYNEIDIARDLSEWEKRVVALSYFFAIAKERQDKNWILVFDDPVTDFDAWHKQIIASKINEFSRDYDQTIIFTHDEKFFEYMKKQDSGSRFSIQKIHQGSIIGCIWKEQRELYEKDLENFYSNGLSGDEYFRIRELTYKLRYCIESQIKNDWLLHNEERFDRILDGLEKMPKWTEKQVKTLKEMYSFCNMNGTHEWSCEWYNGLKKNFKWYCNLGYRILPSTQ